MNRSMGESLCRITRKLIPLVLTKGLKTFTDYQIGADMLDLDGNSIDFINGYAETTVQNLDGFFSLLRENGNFKGCLFRGQKYADWKLVPTTLREVGNSRAALRYKDCLKYQQEQFRIGARGHVPSQSSFWTSETETWAFGRHYGLLTPTLDFTASPAVALFFAFHQKRTASISKGWTKERIDAEIARLDQNRAIYVLDASDLADDNVLLEAAVFELLRAKEACDIFTKDETKKMEKSPRSLRLFLDSQPHYMDDTGWRKYLFAQECLTTAKEYIPSIICPSAGENKRILHQRGVFLKWNGAHSFEECVRNMHKTPVSREKPKRLLKILIPDLERISILEHLYEMNVNYLSLFPDIQGTALYQNWKFQRMLHSPHKYLDKALDPFDYETWGRPDYWHG